MARHNVTRFDQCMWVAVADSFALRFEDSNGDEVMIDMPIAVATAMLANAEAGLQQIAHEERPDRAPQPPQRVLRYTAEPSTQHPGEVQMVLDLDRANALVARLTALDARSLAALLNDAANGPRGARN